MVFNLQLIITSNHEYDMPASLLQRRVWALPLLAASMLTVFSCNAPQEQMKPSSTGFDQARLSGDLMFYALTDGNQLLQLSSGAPSTPMATISVTGLMPGDRLVSIDFRPATGQLYAVSSMSRMYTINPMTGAARAVGTAPLTPAIDGDGVGLDFNPTVDRIRLVTNKGQDLRLNPETGAVQAVDGVINGAPGAAISGVAYTNNFAGATTTTLFTIDPVNDKLYRQDPPNNGTQVEIGPLGVDIIGLSGFDISPAGEAIAALGRTGAGSELYEINLSTGQATKVGNLPNMSIIGLAIPTAPVAYAVDGLNRLMIFNPLNPGTPIVKMLTGLQSGEMLVGIDFRPANGQLYAISSRSQLYTINTSNGAVTAVGTPISPMLTSVDVGFDFNPTVDRIRVVTSTGQNLRLNPDNGTVAAIDGNLNPGMPNATGSAYTNNFAGATTTVLYNLDAGSDKLVRQDPPNAGGLVDVGPLGWNIEGANGFDIGGTSNTAYALLRAGVVSGVYRINLMTGAATPVATFPSPVQAMAVGLGF
ncbi:DUF4394 domain-containing protein [Rudanella paleaurantiibacter]|uniref:DUF4394 domain-containing protein n=2 Tax=Rudanella paleaurantiibacter TaxID=2614655 RepID=A0A7J5U3Y7_9BACT|nr:DUF4394 domain-containing protein [Rudanella paleaurantiibacter]